MPSRKIPDKDSEEGQKLIEVYLMGDFEAALKLSGLANLDSLGRAMRTMYGVYRSKDWRVSDKPEIEVELPPKFKELKTKSWEEQIQVFKQMDDLAELYPFLTRGEIKSQKVCIWICNF